VSARAPRNPAFAETVRASFAAQAFMATLGATLGRVEAGEVELELPFSPALVQQHGYLHAGALTAVLDSACGYAAYTLMAAEQEVLTTEFSVHLLEPAAGERLRATGRVVRAGRTLTVCDGVLVDVDAPQRPIATMTATLMAVSESSGGTPVARSAPAS
jgi:uncharacterized protein (TIGR00369 family)